MHENTSVASIAPVQFPSSLGMRVQPGPIRLAVIDSDTGFVRVLVKRIGEMGWQHRVLTAPPRAEDLLSMRLHALVIDLALLGPQGWEFLEKVCDALPGLGVVVCTGQSTVAQRVRGLRIGADDWVTKPCHPQEVIARVEAVVRRRKRTPAPPSPATRRRWSLVWRRSSPVASAPPAWQRTRRSWPARSRSAATSS